MLSVLSGIDSFACTSVIFSSKVTADGRPLMWKNRDTGCLDNRLEFFRGEKYSYFGLVNSGHIVPEVWIGVNESGFSIMNTASYNIKDDEIPQSEMDKEGILMAKALGVCGSVSDFEHYLDTCTRPMGVEAQFGVIDAFGSAAYFEVNNHKYVKLDINDQKVAPDGYLVVTNFSFSGRQNNRLGVERYQTANAIIGEMTHCGVPYEVFPEDIFNSLSRSLRNELMGVDFIENYEVLTSTGVFKGIVADLDFIPRRSTSSSVVIHGVRPGDNPLGSVFWAVLGYPFTSVAIPVPLCSQDIIPSYLKSSEGCGNAAMCNLSLFLKNKYIFRFNGSNGQKYMDISTLADKSFYPYFPGIVSKSEAEIRNEFENIYSRMKDGSLTYDDYILRYRMISENFYNIFLTKLEGIL